MTKKKGTTIFTVVLILFFVSVFYRNVTTYNSIKNHTGYTFGTIIKVWDDDDSWYSRYEYNVHRRVFLGRQGEKHSLKDIVLIVYDTTKPRFSMIAEYSYPVKLDSNNKIILLDTSLIKYSWWDYLPGDNIHSIKDLWSLD